GGDEVTRNHAADDLVDELERPDEVRRKRLDIPGNAGVLTFTTRLLLVGVVEGCLLRDRLAERHLGLTDDDLAVVLALDAFAVNLEMELTHARDDGLGGFLVAV